MTPITMDPAALIRASEQYENARNSADEVIRSLAASLDANWGCAGTDTAGAQWARSYDPAAFDAVAAGTNIVHAFGKLHDLLAATGVNHANTERANRYPPEPPHGGGAQLTSASAPRFNGSFGGDTDAPVGWGLITRWLQGRMWPNGDPGTLRVLGSAWSTAADGLRRVNDGTGTAWAELEDLVSGEMPQALAQMDGVFVSANLVADQYEKLGVACHEWAQVIDDAHQKVFDIVGTAIVAGAVVGVVAGLFTMGAGTVAATGATGSAIAASVVGVLGAVDAAAVAAVGGLVAAGTAAAGVANDLQPLLDASPTTFNANTAGGGNWNYVPAPELLPGFPKAMKVKPLNRRKRWVDDKGNIYEWDSRHGAVEKYTKNGKHLGEFDPNTGAQNKPADPTRKPGR